MTPGSRDFLRSVFLRGALDPFDLLALDVLTSVVDIAEANALTPYSVLARSAGFVQPLEDRVWMRLPHELAPTLDNTLASVRAIERHVLNA